MLRNSGVLAAATVMVCDLMASGEHASAEVRSEREIFLARSAEAVRAQRLANRKAWRMPTVSWRGVTAALPFRRPRLAA